MTETIDLMKQGLSQSLLFDMTERDSLLSMSLTLAHEPRLIKEMLHSYKKKELIFECNPLIGTILICQFVYEENQVLMERHQLKITLTTEQWLYWLGVCDLVFQPIYPIGTTVTLNQPLLVDESHGDVKDESEERLVTLIGRKVPINQDGVKGIIDYVGVAYPYGILPETPPLLLSTAMIDQVKQMGWQSEFDREVCHKVRIQQLNEQRLSVIFLEIGEKALKFA